MGQNFQLAWLYECPSSWAQGSLKAHLLQDSSEVDRHFSRTGGPRDRDGGSRGSGQDVVVGAPEEGGAWRSLKTVYES